MEDERLQMITMTLHLPDVESAAFESHDTLRASPPPITPPHDPDIEDLVLQPL